MAVSVIPLGVLWFVLMMKYGDQITPEMNNWSTFIRGGFPKWFYIAPLGFFNWVSGLFLLHYLVR